MDKKNGTFNLVEYVRVGAETFSNEKFTGKNVIKYVQF